MTSTNDSVDASPQFRVGPYLVYETIGEGAMGIVYRGVHTFLLHSIALKTPLLGGANDALERFVQEAKLEGRLHHPNIAVVHEYLEHDGKPWLVMEYFELGTVRTLVGHITDAECALVLADVLRGLGQAHSLGVVHRDLKPENLMRTNFGQVKIADFGIAKAMDDVNAQRRTVQGWFLGDPRYVAPEVVQGQAATSAADLYAVGVIAYELFSGRTPFADLETQQVPYVKVHQSATALADTRHDLDQDLCHWVTELLHRDPRKRSQSAQAALESLEQIAEHAWGASWHRVGLPTVGDGDHQQPEYVYRPPSLLVRGDVVQRYASPRELLLHAAFRRRNLVTLVVALICVLVTFAATDSLRPVWVIAGLAVIYGGLVATTYFDQREAFKAAQTAGPQGS